MALLDYTTTVPVRQSLAEIQEFLAAAGARRISVEYGPDRQPVAFSFTIGTELGDRPFLLPARTERVLVYLEAASEERGAGGRRKLPASWVTPEHAQRVAWRVLRDWLQAQLALIAIGMADAAEVLMPYELVEPGKSLYGLYRDHQAQLPAPEGGA